MPIEELAKMLPTKQADTLKNAYYNLPDEKKDAFLQKASDKVRQYSDNENKIIKQEDSVSSIKKSYVIPPSVFKKIIKPATETLWVQIKNNVKQWLDDARKWFAKLFLTNEEREKIWHVKAADQFYLYKSTRNNDTVPTTNPEFMSPVDLKDEQMWKQRAASSNYDDMIKKWYSRNYTNKQWKKNPWLLKQFTNQIFKK